MKEEHCLKCQHCNGWNKVTAKRCYSCGRKPFNKFMMAEATLAETGSNPRLPKGTDGARK